MDSTVLNGWIIQLFYLYFFYLVKVKIKRDQPTITIAQKLILAPGKKTNVIGRDEVAQKSFGMTIRFL